MSFRVNYLKSATLAVSTLVISGSFYAQNTIQDGLKFLDADKSSKAKEVFENLVNTNPSAENYYYLGYYYLNLENPNIEKAQEAFNAGIQKDAKYSLNKVGLGTIKIYQKDFNGAQAIFSQILKDTREKDADALFRIGESYILFKDCDPCLQPDKTIEYLTKAIDKAKKIPADYYITLGKAYYEKSDPGNAMTNYNKAMDVDDSKIREFTLIGNLWARSGQNNLAEENFKKALTLDPNYAPVYRHLAAYYILHQQFDAASANLKKYIELSDADTNSVFRYAKLSYLAKDYDSALTELNKIWDKIDDNTKYKVKAYILLEKKDYAGAKENIDKYFSLAQTSKLIGADYGTRGRIELNAAESETDATKKESLSASALADMEKAIQMGDNSYNYEADIARVYIAKNDVPKAIETYKKAIEKSPMDTKLIFGLAVAQQNSKDYAGALESWNKLIALIPDWPVSYVNKAIVAQNLDQKDSQGIASQAYQKYIELVESNATANDTYGLITAYTFFAYKANSANDKASVNKYADKILALDPTNTEAKKLKGLK